MLRHTELQCLWREFRQHNCLEETYDGGVPGREDCYFYQIGPGDIDAFPMWTHGYPA